MTVLATGLTDGILVFLVACGLTLVLGVMGVANFSCGGEFMIGAYPGYEFIGGRAFSAWLFVLRGRGGNLAFLACGAGPGPGRQRAAARARARHARRQHSAQTKATGTSVR
jgi:branched-subunit amino acid ABC-type transport system permease component